MLVKMNNIDPERLVGFIETNYFNNDTPVTSRDINVVLNNIKNNHINNTLTQADIDLIEMFGLSVDEVDYIFIDESRAMQVIDDKYNFIVIPEIIFEVTYAERL